MVEMSLIYTFEQSSRLSRVWNEQFDNVYVTEFDVKEFYISEFLSEFNGHKEVLNQVHFDSLAPLFYIY